MDPQTKKRNQECSILFIQQEHANTLKGLHEEISNLQKKCSELTFQVAMSNTSISQEDEFREKCESLENELKLKIKCIQSLEHHITQKDKAIETLEQKLAAQKRKEQDFKKIEKTTIIGFHKQLDEKAESIATLNAKNRELREQIRALHAVTASKLRASPRSSIEENSPVPPRVKSGKAQLKSVEDSHDLIPVPPPKQEGRYRPGPFRRLPEKPGTPENIPDPAPFLVKRENTDVRKSAKRTILPPINARTIVPPQKADSFNFVKKGLQNVDSFACGTPEIEVETPAVIAAPGRDHERRYTQKYQSTE